MPWVDNRENEIVAIMARLYPLTQVGADPLVVTLDRQPVGKILPAQVPAILLFEGQDVVTAQAGRNTKGPQKRTLTLAFELWVLSDDDDLSVGRLALRSLYNNARRLILDANIYEKELTRIYTSVVPGIIGVGMVTELQYVNNGN